MDEMDEKEQEIKERVSPNRFDDDDDGDFQARNCGSWEASGGYLPHSIVKSDPPREEQ